MKKLLKETHRFLFNLASLMLQIFPDSNFGNSVRGKILGLFCKGTKRRLQICKCVHLLYPHNISIGDDVYVGYGCWINAQAGISIGSESMLGPYVCIATGNHTLLNNSFRFGVHKKMPVKIGFGCWLAAKASIMPGVTLADRTVVAANAVVTKTTSKEGVYAGIPSKWIKGLGE